VLSCAQCGASLRPAHVPIVIHDFRHTSDRGAGAYNGAVTERQDAVGGPLDPRSGWWMSAAAIGTWIVCGLSPLAEIGSGGFVGWPAMAFVAAFAAFGAALMLCLFRPARPDLASLTVQSIAALVMVALTTGYARGSGVTSAALVIVAAQLPYRLHGSGPWTWIAVQTVTLALVLAAVARVGWLDTVTFSAAIGGFQLFAASSTFLARRQAEARAALARANEELRATRALLAERSRAEERVRIARDLHDTLGHHLTALSLQLDVASRLTNGKPAEHVQQAHAITRLLLGDVRDVVSRLRETGPLDLVPAVQSLAAPAPGLTIHLDVPGQLPVDEPDRSQAVIRCVQEIITNSRRHSGARNLWLRLEPKHGGVQVHARDDGGGAAVVTPGHGLTGMSERFAAQGGRVTFSTRPGGGFEVDAYMPGGPPG
jgi:signal transduction histidine kinase